MEPIEPFDEGIPIRFPWLDRPEFDPALRTQPLGWYNRGRSAPRALYPFRPR